MTDQQESLSAARKMFDLIVRYARSSCTVDEEQVVREIDSIIAPALTAARQVPPGHVRGSDGVDRKVLGTLPVTADGCVAGHGCTVYGWHPDDGKGVTIRKGGVQAWIWHSAKGQNWSTPTDSCYSTREAAQAAQARSKAQ